MQYCPHCMKPVAGPVGPVCPNCGGDMNWTGQKGIDLPVGTVLSGGNGLRTYQVGAARGKGGFGITYIAIETNSGRRMAVKEYFPTRCAFRGGNGVGVQAMTGQEEPFLSGMNSFLEEGKMLLSQDDLACVVHVIDYFQANGTAYLVMEYLDGVALHTQMTRMGGRIPVSELMPRLNPLMRDIGQLHRRGVIHRDISPDNIMWMPDGGLKLLDFGSARSMESGKSMTVLMKQGFSPIEQYRSKGQGPYTDIYALAATIYYCVTGVIPPASMERLGEDTLQSPIALGAPLTVQQEAALLWALSIQPEARPQSMEEFAGMLYKPDSGAVPAGPAAAGASYSSATSGFQPQSERPAQTPPASAAGQDIRYQYGYSNSPIPGPGQVTDPGQYAGTGQGAGPGQYAGPGQGAGPGQYAGPGQGTDQGRYVGPGQGQNWSGGGGNGGGKNKLPLFIGIGAAAAVIIGVLIGVFVWLSGGDRDTVERTSPPPRQSASVAPAPSNTFVFAETPAPTDPPAQDTVTIGLTDDGFYYELVGQDHVVLTGCAEDANFSYMPDDVDGIPVTEIAADAFTGVSTGSLINLPFYLESIGANAFRNCGDVLYVAAYSTVATDPSSFSGCPNIWCVSVRDEDASGWNLPVGTSLYHYGMDVELGTLVSMTRSGGVLTGETEDGYIVLLDVISGTDTLDGLEEVDWICSWALDNLSSGAQINLGDYTMYSYDAFNNSFSWYAPDATLADMWMLSCATAREINSSRPGGATQIKPDMDLMYAAMVRAQEYAQSRDATYRPDGSEWDSILEEEDIDYKMVMCAYGNDYSDYAKMWNDIEAYMVSEYGPAVSQSDSANYAGQYCSKVGVAVSEQADGQYCCWGFVLIT